MKTLLKCPNCATSFYINIDPNLDPCINLPIKNQCYVLPCTCIISKIQLVSILIDKARNIPKFPTGTDTAKSMIPVEIGRIPNIRRHYVHSSIYNNTDREGKKRIVEIADFDIPEKVNFDDYWWTNPLPSKSKSSPDLSTFLKRTDYIRKNK